MPIPNPIRLNLIRFIFLVALLLSAGIFLLGSGKSGPDFSFNEVQATGNRIPVYKQSFVCNPCDGPAVHSASIVRRSDGVLVSWFGGSREGSRDVKIYLSEKSAASTVWTPERPILDSYKTSQQLDRYIKKLGNPVFGRDKNGRLWLFYVTVSAGGWSGSSINYQVSSDEGKTWSSSSHLITSPFFNVSTLVRGSPIAHKDGSLSLPVYHELLGKFTELLHISSTGKVLSKRRISHGRESFQPAMIPLSKKHAVMVMRHTGNSPRQIMISNTHDAGKTWSSPVATSLPNPDAGVSIASGPDNILLVVYNDSKKHRGNLALAISRDLGASWKKIHYFEREEKSGLVDEYSYPTIIRKGNQYHLVYTWKRKGIRYITFNNAWLRRQEKN